MTLKSHLSALFALEALRVLRKFPQFGWSVPNYDIYKTGQLADQMGLMFPCVF